MKPNQKIDSFESFFWKRSQWPILIVIGIFILFYENYPPAGPDSIEAPHVWEWFERMFAYITFFVALLLWRGQKRAEWIDYLPNRLTVTFYCKLNATDEYVQVMQCREAILSNESDIRALSQAIGMQMNGGPLTFIPAKVEIDPYELNKKRGFLHYRVRIYLTKLPEKLEIEPVPQDHYLVWGPDFDKDPVVKRIQS
ncbi:MAG: hypothetical protein KIT45_04395 [Fimbriimonadia bacterium]|nr:hypothetical protein [Fimbriimonadia bacterium]